MTRARIGVAGFGSIGRRHARVAAELGHEVVVFDPAGVPDARHPYAVAPTFEDLLAARPDAVIVAGPDGVHAAQTVAAMRAGVPVLVEKPLADSPAAASEVVACQEDTGVPVLVGYVLRHSDVLAAVAHELQSGTLGRLVSFHVELGAYETLELARNRFDNAPAGAIYGDYSHEWHYVDWLLGPIVRGLAAERLVPGLPLQQSPNAVDGLLELAGGEVGTFHLDYVQRPSRRVLRAIGTSASLEADVPAGRVLVSTRKGALRELAIEQPRDGIFEAQLVHLLAVARGEQQPLVPPVAALRALRVATALRSSAAERRWVRIGVDAPHPVC